jgi:hypothetical protein
VAAGGPGASHAGGTQSSNPLCSSEESRTNRVDRAHDLTPAFQTYLRPLLGSDLPQPARLRGGIVAKVLKR